MWVTAYDGQAFHHGLGDQQAIKRIAVVPPD
jgi:hypothetical protein